MAVHAYADETIFNIDTVSGEKALGCGILICNGALSSVMIEEALSNLKADPDFDNRLDLKTLKKGFFHASSDSKNAHSHLCRAINKYVKGVLDFSFWRNVEEKDLSKPGFQDQMFQRCLSNSTFEFFNNPEEVILIIESREGLSNAALDKWLKRLYHMYEGATYDIPSFVTFFPKFTIKLADKSHPGLQVVDFLLWAANRSVKANPDRTWIDRFRFSLSSSYALENGHNRSQYFLNLEPSSNDIKNYPVAFETPQHWDDFIEGYILMEKFFHHLEEADFGPHAQHLVEEFVQVSNNCKNDNFDFKSKDFEQMGSIFIKMFDTLPLYDLVTDLNEESWRLLFYAKYLASYFVRTGQIHFHRTKNEIARWRYQMKREHGEQFKQILNL